MGDLSTPETRFGFGANWHKYSSQIDETRIAIAQQSLREMLGDSIAGKSFLDVGCGSVLFSLAARRLGARVRSFDLDHQSVGCTRGLRWRFSYNDLDWAVEQGSILDANFLSQLGTFDIVYSWGVLHHTGNMRQAIVNAASLVAPGGLLMIAIYKKTSFCWLWSIEKRWYVSTSDRWQSVARAVYSCAHAARYLVRGRSFKGMIAKYSTITRGMHYERDVHDWLGGYPYESATDDEVCAIVQGCGLRIVRKKVVATVGLLGTGNNEFVFSN